jgi:DTW domain-containing protein YfiP
MQSRLVSDRAAEKSIEWYYPAMVIRCSECLMRAGDCLCEEIPRIETATRVVLILHHSEIHRPSNTGRLVAKSLINSELRVHGSLYHTRAGEGLLDEDRYDSYVLFPSEDAIELQTLLQTPPSKPLRVIVPDGTWSQANRIAKRIPELRGLKRLKLPVGDPSHYVLRRNQAPGRVCTLEAIAGLLGEIEGKGVEESLRGVLDLMVRRTLKWQRSTHRMALYEELARSSSDDDE